MQIIQTVFFLFLLSWFGSANHNKISLVKSSTQGNPYLVILGTVQDAGSPHIACKKECCKNLFKHPDANRKVVSLGIVDPVSGMDWIIEATPDLPAQMKALKLISGFENEAPDGILITHAHIGHYAGLMYLGREAMNENNLPVYAMPKMKTFLESNGPWSQLVSLKNIRLEPIENGKEITLSSQIKITPFIVPHRDEYSETVGYVISGKNKKALFIPDIDKWTKWDKQIINEIKKVDYALIDATFFDGDELKGRDISEIPHPFVIETMATFENLPDAEKNKIYFIHFNHTNPLLNIHSRQSKEVIKKGFHVAGINQKLDL